MGPVHAIGWFAGRFGYNVHTRNFFAALSRRVPVAASRLVGTDGPWREDRRILLATPGCAPSATIALLYGNMMDVLDGAPGKRIAYTVWESTRYPDDWLGPLDAADEIWLPTAWGKRVLAENGIAPEKIHVVPEGVDPALFAPDGPSTSALAGFPGFRFINVGRYEERKGTRLLIECFDKAFGDGEEVRLVLACDNHHDAQFDIRRILRSLDLKHPERIVFIPPMGPHGLLAELYRACDAFVSPFRAEGWGLPIIEAMASGLPVIATDYSGPTEFLGEAAYRLAHAMTPILQGYFESANGDYGEWADPDPEHLIALMRHVYRNRDEAKRRGLAGAAHVRENFTWDRATEVAVRRLGS